MSEGAQSSCCYPINPIPFEAFYDGSWHHVHFIRIQNGSLFVEINHLEKIMLNIHSNQLRIRSRKATSLDCTNFLKKGTDVCALLHNPATSNSNSEIESQSLAWVDAKIIRVEKHHHENNDTCKCKFIIMPYRCEGPMYVREKHRSGEPKTITIKQISILQNIIHEPDENGIFLASCSENNSSLRKTKLKVTDLFSSEISWLIVLSSLRGVNFDIKMVENKIIYHILTDDVMNPNPKNMKIIRFKDSNGVPKPTIETISIEEKCDLVERNEVDLIDLVSENISEEMNIRRSKRCNKSKPDIFSSYSSPNFGRFYPPPSAKNHCSYNSPPNDKTVKKENFTKSDQWETFGVGNKERERKTSKKENSPANDKTVKKENFTESEWETFGVGNKKRRRKMSKSYCDKVIEELLGDIKLYIGKKRKPADRKKEKGVCEPGLGYYPETEDFTWPSPKSDSEVEKEKDENQELWDQMDLGLTEIALEEQKKNFVSDLQEGDIEGEGSCVHECELDEQIGLICKLCNAVCTEIRDILPPLMKEGSYKSSLEKDIPINNPLHIDPFTFANLHSEISEPKPFKNIWASIPKLEPKLHNHQRKAFEFLWKNLTGKTNLENMKPSNKTKGGCVISHSPGSGKTLTVISFLTSYLAVNPNSRPLVITPKSAVHTWEKEFQKWEVEIPVFIIHRRPTKGRDRIMDSLKMIKSWHENPSVLVMTYPSFLSLAKENSKDDYGKLMSNVLLNNPELLVLDEGHNPRNTKSKLRKLLMKVKTKLRILLSGTVFQNNFAEYFNTLCLARPKFVKDLINELDPKKGERKIKKGKKKAKNEERKARNLFVENIGERIESSDAKERKQGINLLKQLTFNFIDTFDGQNLDNLPGLETYTIFLKSTKTQEKILNRLQNSFKHGTRYPIEIELLVSIGSIHPWLVTTSKCSKDFFTKRELKEIEKHSTNSSSGSKTHFVIDIIIKSLLKKEKVLIFCHNLAPLNLLVNLLESLFGWTKGEEILVLLGEQDLTVRSEMIDKFNNDKQGKRKVLLASTNACAEGINLTAASRVVLLDSEWNHSKTKQAIARAFRLGQEKKVYVYLLLGAETWEEGKYMSNMRKAWMSKMVVLGRSLEREKRERVDEGEIEDEMLREIVREDRKRTVNMVVKHE